MSKIDKLSILGLRSFDNQQPMTIQFYTPLTLIVGTNGSGKTTIIECLKYVTTGMVPPNTDKGATFIHDAKLCGESEVLAQIRLGFKSIEGTKSVCTRSLQLTVKRASRSFKTLEGNVKMVRDGQTLTVTSKQTSLDTLMPQLMGVSRAVLDGVIFCHQEDSLWPLQKSSDLKVRFDQIFDAQKYTKAVEAIKILQKTKRNELPTLSGEEKMAKTDNDRARRARGVMANLEDETEELRAKLEELDARMKEAQRKADDAWSKGREAAEIVVILQGKRSHRENKQQNVDSLRKTLVEMTDSDEDLQEMLEQYEERALQYEEALVSKQGASKQIQNRLTQADESLNSKSRECGMREAEKQAHARHLEAREQLVKDCARSHSIRGYDGPLNANQIRDLMDRIGKRESEQSLKLDQARDAARAELQHVQERLNQLNERKSRYHQEKQSSNNSISAINRKLATLQEKLNEIAIDEGSIVHIQSQLRDVQSRLQNAKVALENTTLGEQVQSTEAELGTSDLRKDALNTELVEATRRAGESARLDYMHKELKDRQRSLRTMVDAHGKRIASVVGEGWSPPSLDADFQRKMNESVSNVAEAERQRDGVSREAEQVTFRLNTCQSDVKSKESDLKIAAQRIEQAVGCQPHEYLEEVEKLESSRDYLKADADSFKMMFEYFDACIKAAKEKNACRTCSRGLKGKEVDVLLRTVEREKKRMEDATDMETLKQTEEDLKAAKAVSSDFDTWERLKQKEIPQLHTEQSDLLQTKDKLIKQLEEQDALVDEKNVAKREVDGLSRHVQSIVKYNTEIASFDSQIGELTARQQSAGMSRGLEAIQEDLKAIDNQQRDARSRLQKFTSELDRGKTSVSRLEIELRDVQNKLSTAEYQLDSRKGLEGQVAEEEALGRQLREQIKSTDDSLQALSPEIAREEALQDDMSKRAAEQERELQLELNKLSSTVNELKQADQTIQRYLDSDGPALLERANQEAKQLQEDIRRLKGEQSLLEHEIKALEDQFRNQDQTKRSIAENQRFRLEIRQLRSVDAEIEELESHDAEQDKKHWDHEEAHHRSQHNALHGEWSKVHGTLGSKQQELNRECEEYQSEYKNAARRYKEAHILVETTKAAIEDLGRYGGALDRAIMKFHEMKMEDINRIIEELWRKTYQGTDVDTIMIRSESESAGNKSYNYRVVMVKQDVEMDMRGRCSAGQKVLACIIIRLALAECFGVNCGLIALDEPTTNLDRENIRALARSLGEIIRVRRAQRNFQLIVITHDEEFLQLMNCADFTDYYYRVSRDERQKSVIDRQKISEVWRRF